MPGSLDSGPNLKTHCTFVLTWAKISSLPLDRYATLGKSMIPMSLHLVICETGK